MAGPEPRRDRRRRRASFDQRRPRSGPGSLVGTEYELDVGPVAHGGICVARHEGRVIFVRHTLPGERVRARVTEGRPHDRFLRADAVEVLTPSPDRVTPPCPYAGPGRCGGCDWQHATLGAQRRLKAAVLAEQLLRLAKLDRSPEVEAVPGAADGSGWRTRVRFAVDLAGRPGLRRYRSHDVVPIDECFIAHPAVNASGVLGATWPGTDEVAVTAAGDGAVLVRPSETERGGERVGERTFAVPAAGFWQVHPAAAATLAGAVAEALAPQPGDALLDLYAGSGLFAGMLAASVTPGGSVVAVEGDATAVAAARDNLNGLPGVSVVADRVDSALASGVGRADLVVLDPPRTGAGRAVVEAIAELRPRRVVYVACDPAALARDIAIFAERGYSLSGLRAFDLFPHTHHLEAVATLEPTGSPET
ncbi:MAG TPA: class I SAM-dependent RNA methyltransferase [Sporichthya sp.]|nr:class I SAM-dependent RNA methyltransferase [Sporichthya sp.]